MKFIITIDTEGDNLWSRPEKITTQNSASLYRFQKLCEKYSFKPVYLANWEMANCQIFREFGNDIIKSDVGEIGMHLHAWNSPPLFRLTKNDYYYQPYLIEYPEHIINEKIKRMTVKLEDVFQQKMISHRAGRWAFNGYYAKVLEDQGYRVDCSITPSISWSTNIGDPKGRGGCNYQNFPTGSYFLNINDISKSGNSKMLEVPTSIYLINYPSLIERVRKLNQIFAKSFNYIFPKNVWIRPSGKNSFFLKKAIDKLISTNSEYIQFMLHSSELLASGSPNFKSIRSINKLYRDIERIFDHLHGKASGVTLKEFYCWKINEDNSTLKSS